MTRKKLPPFVRAFEAWNRAGETQNFVFAGERVLLSPSRDFRKALARRLPRVSTEQVAEEIRTALELFPAMLEGDAASVTASSPDFCNGLRALMALATLKGCRQNAADFQRVMQQRCFDRVSSDQKRDLMACAADMALAWVISPGPALQEWDGTERQEVRNLVLWLEARLDDRDMRRGRLSSIADLLDASEVSSASGLAPEPPPASDKKKTRSFAEALDVSFQRGIDFDFMFAGREIGLQYGETIIEAIYRATEKTYPVKVAREIAAALTPWNIPFEKKAAAYGKLSLLMTLSGMKNCPDTAEDFHAVMQSDVVQTMDAKAQKRLASEAIWMANAWCLNQNARIDLWPKGKVAKVHDFIVWLSDAYALEAHQDTARKALAVIDAPARSRLARRRELLPRPVPQS